MSKAALLLTTALVAISAGAAWAAAISTRSGGISPLEIMGAKRVLYNQNSNDAGQAVDSQNFTSGAFTVYDDQGADDFVVPKGERWTITEIDVTGDYYYQTGYPAESENIFFYKNKKSLPGKPVRKGTFMNVIGLDNRGEFAIPLPGRGLTLGPGHYWVSVQANLSFSTTGTWGWEMASVTRNDPAVWQNPENGYGVGCETWGTLGTCVGSQYSGYDLMFDLKGASNRGSRSSAAEIKQRDRNPRGSATKRSR